MGTIYSKNISYDLEGTLKALFKCDVTELNVIISADAIEDNPIQALYLGLALKYRNADKLKREEIDKFTEYLFNYEHKNIVEIGEKTFNSFVEKFDNLIK